jgi:hypothetical protein
MWITIDLKLLTRFITTAAKNKMKKNRKSSGNFEFQGTRQAAQIVGIVETLNMH